ncbi:MAG: zinc ribbon domain-containing protein [Candidatus Bathyarchaeia archaeon]
MPFCPKCGREIETIGRTGQGLCPTCGVVDIAVAPVQGRPSQFRYCQYCGKELSSEVSSCPNCGKPTRYTTPVAAPIQPISSKLRLSRGDALTVKKWVIPVLIIISLIVGFGIGYAAAPRQRIHPSTEAVPVMQTSTRASPTLVETKLKTQVIEDLAYIKIMAGGYSDDADPEDDGLAIDIMYYNSRSEAIGFSNIPILVRIEVFGYRDILDTFDHDKDRLVYKTTVTVDHSMTLKEMFGNYIRIPFEDMGIDENEYYVYGTVKVTVETQRGNFADIWDLAPLYPTE